jgi:hypothetical protein
MNPHTHLTLWSLGGLIFKAYGLVYHSTLDWRVIKKKKIWNLAPAHFSRSVSSVGQLGGGMGLAKRRLLSTETR